MIRHLSNPRRLGELALGLLGAKQKEIKSKNDLPVMRDDDPRHLTFTSMGMITEGMFVFQGASRFLLNN